MGATGDDARGEHISWASAFPVSPRIPNCSVKDVSVYLRPALLLPIYGPVTVNLSNHFYSKKI